MDGEAILTVSAAVVALTQIAKWAGIPDKIGPIVVLVLAGIGVAVWGFSQEVIDRAETFEYFAGWISVALAAAGTFGFTRAATSAVTSAKAPPAAGAAQSPTEKP
jgi:hypothetical protein